MLDHVSKVISILKHHVEVLRELIELQLMLAELPAYTNILKVNKHEVQLLQEVSILSGNYQTIVRCPTFNGKISSTLNHNKKRILIMVKALKASGETQLLFKLEQRFPPSSPIELKKLKMVSVQAINFS